MRSWRIGLKIRICAWRMGINLSVDPDTSGPEGLSDGAWEVFRLMVSNPAAMRAYREIYGEDFAGMSDDVATEPKAHTATSTANTIRN